MMSLPDTAPRYVLFLLIVLFPIALFLAWAFDIRPTDGGEAARESAMKGFLPVAASVLVLGGFGFFLLRADADVAREPTEPLTIEAIATDGVPAPASLAVLPFTDLSPEGNQEYFGDGIAEALLNVLASLDDLSVASRTSAFAFREANRNVVEIADILNVTHVLEGSVGKAGNRVRITAQLIDAQADRHLWSEVYDRDLDDIFAIQDEIANAIVTALREELNLGLEGDIEIVPVTENLDAYDLYLQARQLWAIGTTENVRLEVELLERAVELDPNFAEAWAELATGLSSLPTWDHSLDPMPYNQRSIAAAERSLALDPLNSTAFRALGSTYYAMHEWERSDDLIRRAQAQITGFDRNPLEPMALGYLSRANDQATDSASRFPERGFYNLLQALYLEAMGDRTIRAGYLEGLQRCP